MAKPLSYYGLSDSIILGIITKVLSKDSRSGFLPLSWILQEIITDIESYDQSLIGHLFCCDIFAK